MKVINKIDIVEVNGSEVISPIKQPILEIGNHWNRSTLVVIKIDDKEMTVSADELRKAIENSTK